MPYCRNCGTEHPEDANFCKKCGEKLKSDNASHDMSNFRNNSNSSTKYTIFMIISIFYPLILFIAFIKSDFIHISVEDLFSYRYCIWEFLFSDPYINKINDYNHFKYEVTQQELYSLTGELSGYFFISILLLFFYYIFFISNQIKGKSKYRITPLFLLASYILIPVMIEYKNLASAECDLTPLLIFVIGVVLEVARRSLFKQIKKEKINQEIQPQNTNSVEYPTFSFEREMVNENITDIDIPIDKQ